MSRRVPTSMPLQRRPRAAALWWLALACWLGSQFLALAHGIHHGSHGDAQHAAHQGASHAAHSGHGHDPAHTRIWFGHDAGEQGGAACQLYDQLTHADAVAAPVVGAVFQSPSVALPITHHLAPTLAAHTRAWARAPPLFG